MRRPRTPHGRRQMNRQGRDHHPLFPALAAVSGAGGGGEGVHRYLKISKIEKKGLVLILLAIVFPHQIKIQKYRIV